MEITKLDVYIIFSAILDGYPYKVEGSQDEEFLVVENPNFREPSDNPNLVLSLDDFYDWARKE